MPWARRRLVRGTRSTLGPFTVRWYHPDPVITLARCSESGAAGPRHWRSGSGVAAKPEPLTAAGAAPRLIARAELVADLDRAAARKVTLISAPAGSGKTSLLRAWAAGLGPPDRLTILQVQRDQRDAPQFWLALLDEVRRASGTAGSADTPAGTPDFDGQAMVDRVLAELPRHHGRTFLVIDD